MPSKKPKKRARKRGGVTGRIVKRHKRRIRDVMSELKTTSFKRDLPPESETDTDEEAAEESPSKLPSLQSSAVCSPASDRKKEAHSELTSGSSLDDSPEIKTMTASVHFDTSDYVSPLFAAQPMDFPKTCKSFSFGRSLEDVKSEESVEEEEDEDCSSEADTGENDTGERCDDSTLVSTAISEGQSADSVKTTRRKKSPLPMADVSSEDGSELESLTASERKRLEKLRRERERKKGSKKKRTSKSSCKTDAKTKKTKESTLPHLTGARRGKDGSMTVAIHLVTTEEECDKAVAHLRQFRLVGFDCEGFGELSRHGKVALIQLSSETSSYLFDLFAFDHVIPQSLRCFLEAKPQSIARGPIKVIHDARADCDCLFRVYGVKVRGVLDTTVLDLVRRVAIGRQYVTRLRSMDGLAQHLLDYDFFSKLKVSYCVAPLRGAELCTNPLKRKKLAVNIFEAKGNMKMQMRRDRKLWGIRPMTRDMVVYAALDPLVTLFIAKAQMKRRAWNSHWTERTLRHSAAWSQCVAKRERLPEQSSRVPPFIINALRKDQK